MKEFDFDIPVDRKNTSSIKWDRYKGRDITPLWVADMDFVSPPAVIDALRQRVEHGVYGYTDVSQELVDVIRQMLKNEYGWEVSEKWFVWLPGLVTGLNVSCRCIGGTGDEVITAVPVYPPFLTAPFFSDRTLVTFNMIKKNGQWVYDFKHLEQVTTSRTKMILLASPHNPTGRVFTPQELKRLADFCMQRDIIICSDEIHSGLVLDKDKKHIPTACLNAEIAKKTITLMAPSKTYNLPGLGFSFAVIPDPGLRKQFKNAMHGIVPHVNTFGFTAALAAYRDSGKWHGALLDYLRENSKIVEETVNRIPGLNTTHVEATYLAWIDARDLGIKDTAGFFEKAGVGLSDGKDFGAPGFLRLNFGCPKKLLEESLAKMERAVKIKFEV
jgi:cystathionine beta-lyase